MLEDRDTQREIIDLARKINRQLQLGRGMFIDADALAHLAAIGVNDIIQQKATEALRSICEARRSIASRANGFEGDQAATPEPVPMLVAPRAPRVKAVAVAGLDLEMERAREALGRNRK